MNLIAKLKLPRTWDTQQRSKKRLETQQIFKAKRWLKLYFCLCLIAVLFTAVFLLPAQRAVSQATPVLPKEKTVGKIEPVAYFNVQMPTGVTVSAGGRIFVNFPRWTGDPVAFTVGEIKNGKAVAYPNTALNGKGPGSFKSVQSVVVDPLNRLWILDAGGKALIGVNLEKNSIFKRIQFPQTVALPSTYLNDVRFDLRRGKAGMAFITDSSSQGGIIVADLNSGTSWRRLSNHSSTKAAPDFLPIVEGQPLMNRPAKGSPTYINTGADGIAISTDGKRLFYCPLASRLLYSVSVDALANQKLSNADVAATVVLEGQKGGAADGLESDTQNRIYVTNYEHNAILRRKPNGLYETLVHDPRVLWPDTLSIAQNGYLYFIANQLHRLPTFHAGKDLRQKPYTLFRTKINAKPVLLK